MHIAVDLYDAENPKHQDFLRDCVYDESWRLMCGIPLNQGLPLFLSVEQFILTRRQGARSAHVLGRIRQGLAGFVSIHIDPPFARLVGGAAPCLRGSMAATLLYANTLRLVFLHAPSVSKILIKTLAFNQPMRRLNEALGFKLEGIGRSEFYLSSQQAFCDLCRYGMFREEFHTPLSDRLLTKTDLAASPALETQLARMDSRPCPENGK